MAGWLVRCSCASTGRVAAGSAACPASARAVPSPGAPPAAGSSVQARAPPTTAGRVAAAGSGPSASPSPRSLAGVPVTRNTIRPALQRWASQVANGWADGLGRAVAQEAPVAKPTGDPRQRPPGTLRKRVKATRPVGFGGTFRFQVQAPGIEAVTTAKGARPHVIRPRNSRVLVWYADGQRRAATFVRHPGNRGTDWFAKGLRRHGPQSLRRAAARTRIR